MEAAPVSSISSTASVANAKAVRVLYAIAALALVLDQVSKHLIRNSLMEGDEVALIPGFMHLTHVINHGAAWGMLEGQRWLLVGISALVVVVLLATARQIAARGLVVASGMGLIFGGAVGNLIDRVVFGSVTDMIDMDTPIAFIRHFPVYNIADSALTVGVCVLIAHTLFSGKGEA